MASFRFGGGLARRCLCLSILFLGLLTTSCSLLEGPQRPTIPTPIPTAPPFQDPDSTFDLAPERVQDPVSDIVPAVDPAIAELVNAVSQQQLLAYVQTLEGFGTRHSYSVTDRADFGVGAARTWIFNEFTRVGSGRLQVEYDDFPLSFDGVDWPQRNVVATLQGTGSHPGVVVLMAHYDSRSFDVVDGTTRAPGANDNATGVAMLLEIARLMSSRFWSQDVLFVAFAAEEQGTHGSRHFVADKMLDGWQIDAAFNNDIIGGRPGIPQSIRVFAAGPDTSPAQQLARYMDRVGALYLPAFPAAIQESADREGRFSDHIRFLNAGIPAVRLTESQEDPDSQHNGLDTSSKIDFSYLRQVVQLNLATVANIVGAPARPPVPNIAQMELQGAYLLTWVPDLQAAGYAILFRPLGSTEFEPIRFVTANDSGNVALTGFNPNVEYAVSMAALSESGRLSLFSPEVVVGPFP